MTRALQQYLQRHFSPATVSQLVTGATGSSNVTLFFSVTGSEGIAHEYVLRTQAEGHQLFLAREVLFQARAMRGLGACCDLPVPEVVLEEPDASIAGAPFFVMRRITGRDLPNFPSWMAAGWFADLPPGDRATVWRNAVEVIARVGRVDWRRDLGFLDAPQRGASGLDAYLAYVEDWLAWALRGREHPTAEAAVRHLRERQPSDAPLELVWGDSTLMNMLHADDLSIAAVLDWEMATVGPAELDLGWFLFMADMYSLGFGIPRLAGLPTRDETVALYAERLGRPLASDLRYYEILAALRMAIVAIRFADLEVQYGRLPADNTVVTSNPATVVLGHYLGIEVPVDLTEIAAAKEAEAAS